jgi:hypothetical protein
VPDRLPCVTAMTQPIPYSPSASTFSPCAAWGTGDGSGVPLVLAHFSLCCLGHRG